MDFKKANRVRTVCAFLCIIFVILAWALTNILSEKFFFKKSISSKSDYSLSETSKQFVQRNTANINIFVILSTNDTEGTINAIIQRDMNELLKKYKLSDKNNLINIEFIDPITSNKQYEALTEGLGSIPTNVVVFTSNGSNKIVPITDMYNIVNGEIVSFRGELVTTSSMINVSNSSQYVIYFLTGHCELLINDTTQRYGLSAAKVFLQNKNYSVKLLDLTEDNCIPSDANLIIIAGAKHKLLKSEVATINKFLNLNGGSVIVTENPFEYNGLENLFEEWGIVVNDELIACDDSNNKNLNNDLLLRKFAPHHVTQGLINFRTPVVFGKTCALSEAENISNDERFQVTKLIISEKQSQAIELDNNAKSETDGACCAAMLSEKGLETTNDINIKSGKLIVIGNDTWLANSKFNLLGNKIFFNDIVSYMLNDDYVLDISSMPTKNYKISMSKSDFVKLLYKLSILPIFFLICTSIVMFLNRK